MYPYLLTTNTLTLIEGTTTHSVTADHPKWDAILDALRQHEWEVVIDLMTPAKVVTDYAGLTIKQGAIFDSKGREIHNAVVPHILTMKEKGFPVEPLLAFLSKLLNNPSKRSRDQIWRFITTNNIVVDPSGDLIFYKKVKDDYFDVHTGKTHCYKPGYVVAMPRHDVDDDPESTCSTGLHVCTYGYLKSFGGDRTVLCRVNPEHIVSVPIDYHNTKVRVCQLLVIREVDAEPLDTQVWDDRTDLDDSIPF